MRKTHVNLLSNQPWDKYKGTPVLLRRLNNNPKYILPFYICGVYYQLQNLRVIKNNKFAAEFRTEWAPAWWNIYDAKQIPDDKVKEYLSDYYEDWEDMFLLIKGYQSYKFMATYEDHVNRNLL